MPYGYQLCNPFEAMCLKSIKRKSVAAAIGMEYRKRFIDPQEVGRPDANKLPSLESVIPYGRDPRVPCNGTKQHEGRARLKFFAFGPTLQYGRIAGSAPRSGNLATIWQMRPECTKGKRRTRE